MAVLNAQFTTLTITDELGNPVEIAQINSYDGFTGEATEIDVTNLQSTAMEFRPGLQDFGDVTIEMQRDPSDPGQTELQAAKAAQSVRDFVLTVDNAIEFRFSGFVRSLTAAGEVNGVLTGSSTIRITGNVEEVTL
jgi:hypothetical protein